MKRKISNLAAIYLISICFFIINASNHFPVVSSLLYLIVVVMSSTFFDKVVFLDIYVGLTLGINCIGIFINSHTYVERDIYLFFLILVTILSYFTTKFKIKKSNEDIEKNMFRNIMFNNMLHAIFILEQDTLNIVDYNDKAIHLFNEKDVLIGKCIKQCIPPNLSYIINLDNLNFEEGNEEIQILGKKFKDIWIDVHIKKFDVLERSYMLLCISDITAHKKSEEKIEYLAYHDVLTNLPNRRFGDEKLQPAIKNALEKGNMLGVLFIDLDQFKDVNDLFGHAAGDTLLKEVSIKLRKSIRKGDWIVRLGGDEFMIILENIYFVDEIIEIANRIINMFSQLFNIKGIEIAITCSIGISVFPQHGTNIKTLLEHADIAMYTAKRNGRNNFQIFSEESNDKMLIC